MKLLLDTHAVLWFFEDAPQHDALSQITTEPDAAPATPAPPPPQVFESCGAALLSYTRHTMSTVAEVIEAVKHFTDEEKDEFLAQLREVAFEDEWDRQIEADAKAGRLDFLVKEADDAIREGTLRDWPGAPRP